MSGYNPFGKKAKAARAKDKPPAVLSGEHLVSVALMRAGKLEHGHKSHAELRRALGDADPYVSSPGDREGFYTSAGRFVTRAEAQDVAVRSGQLRQRMGRELLSSDVW